MLPISSGLHCLSDCFSEFQTMFAEADKNDDGLIDFDEFVMMMLPSTAAAAGGLSGAGNKSGVGGRQNS